MDMETVIGEALAFMRTNLPDLKAQSRIEIFPNTEDL
jgi:hypothetical protein